MKQRDYAAKPPATITPVPKRATVLQRKCACGESGQCEDCKKETLQRRSDGGSFVSTVPLIVHQVLRSPGAPLDPAMRAIMEPQFGHDFGKVRVHADTAAGESAKAVHAAAYTVGRDVVFAPGQHNHRLLAHELTHVVQQCGAAPSAELEVAEPGGQAEHEAESAETAGRHVSPQSGRQTIQRAPWGEEYDPKDEARMQKIKGGIGPIKSTTEIDPLGTEAADEIPKGTLEEIYPFLKADLDSKKVTPETVERYREYLNRAFRTMKINTVEAQANFLAHASEESGQLRAFIETQGAAQHWEEDPSKVTLTPSALPKDDDVNPRGHFEFIGRGAVQVTHEGGYLKVIAELEKTAEQYKKTADKDPKAAALAAQAQEAADAIKANPQNAAKPQYAFIVSAALMKNMGGDRKASQNTPSKEWSGGDSPSGWVGGNEQKKGTPQADALIRKRDAYNKIVCVLLKQAKAAGKKVPAQRMKMWCG